MKAERKYARTMRIDLLQDDRIISEIKGSISSDSSRIDISNPVLSATDFDTLFQSLYDATVLTDFSGAITHANERALRFFDYRRTAISGRSIETLISGASPDILSTVTKNVKAERFTLLQAYCMRSDESLFLAEISVTQLRLSPSPLLCFFIRDITLRREVEEQLRIDRDGNPPFGGSPPHH